MPSRLSLALLLCLFAPSLARANAFELFAKGMVSKNFIASDEWETDVTGTAGLAIILIPQVRVEARYSNITSLQNRLVAAAQNIALTLTDIKTTTNIYSIGVDIDVLGEKSAFQPYIYLGAGYVDTNRSYYLQASADPSTVQYVTETPQRGISGNLGAGFRLRIARALAFEVEAFAYAINLKDKNPLINWSGSVGIRIFI